MAKKGLLKGKEHMNTEQIINDFSEELVKRFNDLEYNANTPRKTIKVNELREQMDWILHDVVPNTIKEFTEKYIEVIPHKDTVNTWIITERGCVITCPNCGERLELCYPDGTEVRYLPHCPYCGKRLEKGE